MSREEAEITAKIGSITSLVGGFMAGYLVASGAGALFCVAAACVGSVGVLLVAHSMFSRIR